MLETITILAISTGFLVPAAVVLTDRLGAKDLRKMMRPSPRLKQSLIATLSGSRPAYASSANMRW